MRRLYESLPASVRQTLVAVLPLFVVIILFIFVGNFGISKVNDLRSKITQAENDQRVLTQKLTLIRTLSGTAASGVNVAISALPDSNKALNVISQLKILALSNGVILSSIKSNTGTVSGNGINQVDISFAVDGTRVQTLSFLENIAKIAPITLVDKIKFIESSGGVRANVSVKSFWTSLPKTIPTVTQPIKDLTTADKDTLVKISALIQPTFGQTPPSFSGINENPFGQ